MYHYTESGLTTVWLANGYHYDVINGEQFTSIDDVDGLHRLIGKILVNRCKPLVADEIRFIRVEMNMSQKVLATLLGVDIQTVARWEKGQTSLPRTADVALRALYAESIDETSDVGHLLRILVDSQVQKSMEKLVFEERGHVWQRAI
ncbi:helix-turn-helix domain-containing protein [Yersinia enterocolitica]|uniref:helix-turn-helix domain-containing protein n=1 Tax=Yersinia enterocolitica TaxID=630 RepID=UPI0005E48046|nr:helix-turn-helix domain-containing protein [Yersinia enterocolitica]EKN3940684.1 helix-turn-helix domain-containing protein [Yersinia enterocolitica]EKN4022258.1 helix-turn-helix domain-containing protein [Yersinia enterocolitica]EKN4085877.1 helix-turn-helix domain-containing protein [Yersinia enterocolitica]EKN4094433.1 helix-turn-helix domain-containing protein [Yersinia enterocolitica]EKN4753797.1 helix-turn-helix domain-containing protein [Yersinia enterocolitica]